jgi:hypothetical protein
MRIYPGENTMKIKVNDGKQVEMAIKFPCYVALQIGKEGDKMNVIMK